MKRRASSYNQSRLDEVLKSHPMASNLKLHYGQRDAVGCMSRAKHRLMDAARGMCLLFRRLE